MYYRVTPLNILYEQLRFRDICVKYNAYIFLTTVDTSGLIHQLLVVMQYPHGVVASVYYSFLD